QLSQANIGIVCQILEGDGPVRVAATKHIRQLPHVVEHIVRMRNAGLVEEREMVLEVARPVAQVIMVAAAKVLHRDVARALGRSYEARGPLVARMAVQVDDLGPREVLPKPRQTEVDAVELQDRSTGGALDQ